MPQPYNRASAEEQIFIFFFNTMSLAIVTTTNEGNILAADSMETYRNSIGDTREGSQTRMKLFQLNSRIGAVACGLSFLENRNIQQHIQEFKKLHELDGLMVKDVVSNLYDYFFEKYDSYLKGVANRKKEDFEAIKQDLIKKAEEQIFRRTVCFHLMRSELSRESLFQI